MTETETRSRESFANRLAKAGYENFYIIDIEKAQKLLTPKRVEIIEELKRKEYDSIRHLSRNLDRDVKQVSEDLDLLYQMSLVDYREMENRKIPFLKHEKIFIEPL